MYGLFGFAQNIQNVHRLTLRYQHGQPIETVEDLRPSYLQFVDSFYGKSQINRSTDPIIQDAAQAKELLKCFSESHLNDLQQENMIGDLYSQEMHFLMAERIHTQIAALKTLNSDVYDLFSLAIHSIVLAESKQNSAGFRAHGGTASSLTGMMWLSLKPELSNQDITELLIHELTHTLVFIDELNFEHFDYDKMTRKEYWATSSILNRSRPMDKVIHSIVVATEILNARKTYLPNVDNVTVHRDTETLTKNTLHSIESVLNLENVDQVCKPRAFELVLAAKKHLLNIA